MEINMLGLVVLFGFVCLYLGFSKKKYASTFFGILAGGDFIVVGYSFMTKITYMGWGAYNVIIYDLTAGDPNATGFIAVGAFFAMAGVLMVIFSIMLALWGDAQKHPGSIAGVESEA
jgi:hypothetical protein